MAERQRRRRTTDPPTRADLISWFREQGPYDGESHLAFECSLAYIERGRQVWLDAYMAAGKVLTKTCRILGIAFPNAYSSMAKMGLNRELLDKLADGAFELN